MENGSDSFEPRFGHYWLLGRIGRGGMAEIFRALASGTGAFTRLVAIKRMLAHLSADPDFVDRFIAEAKLTSQLNHANIVHLFDFGLVDEQLYLCMEYMQGITLAELARALAADRRLVPIPEVCNIIIEALYGLDHAHRQTDPTGAPLQIIHRDLTPSNLLISWEGQVKIADFGIAKAAKDQRHTQPGKVHGKFRYMSPEQAQGKTIDQRSDLFSLGACFYELLTRSPLYPEESGLAGLARVQAARFEPPRKRNPAIPRALEAIVLRSLEKDPHQRYPDAASMRDALEELMFEVGLSSSGAALAKLLDGLFADRIQAEQRQIADELASAQPVDQAPAAVQPSAVKTFVLHQADLPPGLELFPAEDPPARAQPTTPWTDPAGTDCDESPFDRTETAEIPVIDVAANPTRAAANQPAQPVAAAPHRDSPPGQIDTDEIPVVDPLPSAAIPPLPPNLPDNSPHTRTVLDGRPLGARAAGRPQASPAVRPPPLPVRRPPASPLGDNNPTVIRGKPLPADRPEPEDDLEDDFDDLDED